MFVCFYMFLVVFAYLLNHIADVSPDYASTGMLNEGSDVYSFGVLLMEIITGRSPVDYSRAPGEVSKYQSTCPFYFLA